uniref:Uncharacterized protein n=1 Tax=Anguilla anguilla TaxID=7936 RepID=A0A0E9RFA8_ANGAN
MLKPLLLVDPSEEVRMYVCLHREARIPHVHDATE